MTIAGDIAYYIGEMWQLAKTSFPDLGPWKLLLLRSFLVSICFHAINIFIYVFSKSGSYCYYTSVPVSINAFFLGSCKSSRIGFIAITYTRNTSDLRLNGMNYGLRVLPVSLLTLFSEISHIEDIR